MNLDDRQALRRRPFEPRYDGIGLPRDVHGRPHGTAFIRHAVDFLHDEPVSAITGAPTAKQDCDSFLPIAGEQEAAQMIVLIVRER
jgi:hypothetical protein